MTEGQLTTLTSADIQRFERDGYVVVRQGTWPRFMRIKTQVLTYEGRELRNEQQRLPTRPNP